jgi:hypothetical protein
MVAQLRAAKDDANSDDGSYTSGHSDPTLSVAHPLLPMTKFLRNLADKET